MGNSTYKLADIYDGLAAKGIPDPRSQASGYGSTLALELANDALADLITDRFNWKWNSAVARPFYTNSWQQDYPQLAQTAGIIGWGELCDKIDINNTQIPKPVNVPNAPMWRRQLSRVSSQLSPVYGGVSSLCWMYNSDLSYGTWPGAGVTYYPLVTTGVVQQNPVMSMVDANGNYLIVTTFGTTGTTAPAAAANAAEGTTVTDGTVVWTVVSGTSQGFRVYPLPNATGPVYEVIPIYQLDPPKIASLQSLMNPIPDSYIRHFRRALEYHAKGASSNPQMKAEFQKEYPVWLAGLEMAIRQGDREVNSYQLLPASSAVDSVWDAGSFRGTADRPL
jgi:hypothetical protein